VYRVTKEGADLIETRRRTAGAVDTPDSAVSDDDDCPI
jgi:hypothetical protein